TDSANITRKRSNPDKHGHENGKECTRAGDLIAEVSSKWSTQSQTWSTGQPQEDKNPQISHLSLIVKPISLQVLKWITPILGRPGIRALGAVLSTAHGMIKFLTRAGVATIITERAKSLEIQMVRQAEVTTPEPVENVKVAINPECPEQTIMIGGSLSIEGKKAVCEVLKVNLDVFAWKPADMTGVSRILAEHKLGIKKSAP
ncbi:hypothetical protein Tco_1125074, partial [Tanacetum coccineum]